VPISEIPIEESNDATSVRETSSSHTSPPRESTIPSKEPVEIVE